MMKHKKFIVGLTGGIASGKTTVANLFAQKGISLVDADIVARDVVKIGTRGLKKIEEHWGKAILLVDGQLNRAKLRDIIFHNNQERLWLNNLLHPLIAEKIRSDLNEITSDYGILVSPLLFENQSEFLTDRTLVVDVDPEIQVIRTQKRDNVSKEQVEQILKAQLSSAQRRKKADDILINNQDMASLSAKVDVLHKKYLTLAFQYSK